jgi:hypothetical protein
MTSGPIRALLLLLAASLLPIKAHAQRASTQEPWRLYRDDVNGFSFRYPPTLHVVEKPVEARAELAKAETDCQ